MHILIMLQFSGVQKPLQLEILVPEGCINCSSCESLQSKTNILLKWDYEHSVTNNLKQPCEPNPVTKIETFRLSVGRLWYLLPVGSCQASSSTGITYSTQLLRVLPITVHYSIKFSSFNYPSCNETKYFISSVLISIRHEGSEQGESVANRLFYMWEKEIARVIFRK